LYQLYDVKKLFQALIAPAVIYNLRKGVHAKIIDECALPSPRQVHVRWGKRGVEDFCGVHQARGTLGAFQRDVTHLLQHLGCFFQHGVQELFQWDVLFQRRDFDAIPQERRSKLVHERVVPIFTNDILCVFDFHEVCTELDIVDEFCRLKETHGIT
jgi:hypothetical protein